MSEHRAAKSGIARDVQQKVSRISFAVEADDTRLADQTGKRCSRRSFLARDVKIRKEISRVACIMFSEDNGRIGQADACITSIFLRVLRVVTVHSSIEPVHSTDESVGRRRFDHTGADTANCRVASSFVSNVEHKWIFHDCRIIRPVSESTRGMSRKGNS